MEPRARAALLFLAVHAVLVFPARAADLPTTAVATRNLRVAATKTINSVPIPGTRISMLTVRGEKWFLSGRLTAVSPSTSNVMQQVEIRCVETTVPGVEYPGWSESAPTVYTRPIARSGRNNEGVDHTYPTGRGTLALSTFALYSPFFGGTTVCELWVEVATSVWNGRGPYLTALARHRGAVATSLSMVRSDGTGRARDLCPTSGSFSSFPCIALRPGERSDLVDDAPGANGLVSLGSPDPPEFDPATRLVEVRAQVAMTTCQSRSAACKAVNRPATNANRTDVAVQLSVTPVDVAGNPCGATALRVTRARITRDAHHAAVLGVLRIPMASPTCARASVTLSVASLAGDPVEINSYQLVSRGVA